LFGISRQSYYQGKNRQEKFRQTRQKVRVLVNEQRMIMPRLGTRKLHYILQEDLRGMGLKIGRDKLFSILKLEHLLVRPFKSYTKTTNSNHWLHKHTNLIKGIHLSQADQLWVSDITYLKTKECNSYLSLVTDAASRKIMGYHLSEDLRTEGVMEALKMAIKNRVNKGSLIHHSDRGLQYCSSDYQQLLQENGITTSMTDGYDCYQNALAERINGILKNEFLLDTYQDIDQARKVIEQSVDIYNSKRPHLSLKMKTPNQIHKQKTARLLDLSCGLVTSN
jgi:transposase InsO family protein